MVYESKEKMDCETYAVISLKLAVLMLNKGEVKGAVEAANRALETLQELEEMREEEANDGVYVSGRTANPNGFQYEDEVVQCF